MNVPACTENANHVGSLVGCSWDMRSSTTIKVEPLCQGTILLL